MIPYNDTEFDTGFSSGFGSVYWSRLGLNGGPQVPYGDFSGKVADTTAPVLSSPTGAATGTGSASGTVTTDEGNGTLYFWATTNATETAAAIKASGSSQTVTASGAQNVSVLGLFANTTYYLHYVQDDAASNESNVVTSASFTTDASKGGASDSAQARAELKKKLREQYDREIQQILDNLVYEELIFDETEDFKSPDQIRFEIPDVSNLLPEIKREAVKAIDRTQWGRALAVRQAERKRALKALEDEIKLRLEEEEMAAMLIMAHLLD